MHIYNKYSKNYHIFFLFFILCLILINFVHVNSASLIYLIFFTSEIAKYTIINNYYLEKNISPVLNKTKDKDISKLIFNIFFVFFIILEIFFISISFFYSESKKYFFYFFPVIILSSITFFFLNIYYKKLVIITQIFYYIFLSFFLIFDFLNEDIESYIKIVTLFPVLNFIINYLLLRKKIKFTINIFILKDFRTIFFLKKFIKHLYEKEFLNIVLFLTSLGAFLFFYKYY